MDELVRQKTVVRTATLMAVVALASVVVACASSSTTTKIYKPTNPHFSGLYVEETGSPGLVSANAGYWEQSIVGPLGRFRAVNKANGHKLCSYTNTIPVGSILKKYIGQKLTISVVGNSPAPFFCSEIAKVASD